LDYQQTKDPDALTKTRFPLISREKGSLRRSLRLEGIWTISLDIAKTFYLAGGGCQPDPNPERSPLITLRKA
jgi:hypothetical protein